MKPIIQWLQWMPYQFCLKYSKKTWKERKIRRRDRDMYHFTD